MSDSIRRQYPPRNLQPEVGVVASHTCDTVGSPPRVVNKQGDAAYDLTTKAGTPKVGYGGGVYCVDEAGSYWQGTTYSTGNTSFHYRLVHEQRTATTVDRIIFINGVQHRFAAPAAGTIYFTPNNGGGLSISPFSTVGRGPCVWDALYSGGTLTLLCNGRQADQDVIAAVAPAGGVMAVGRHGEHLMTKVYNATETVVDARASYAEEFAKPVTHSWKPNAVGEGPAGGIRTGSFGPDWSCPLGGATLQYVWRTDLSEPAGGHLALTDSGALSMRRIDIQGSRCPVFGSWIIDYEVRDPATDDMIFALSSIPGQDPTLAGSGAYWVRMYTAPGPWWRAGLYLANGAQIDAVDLPFPGPIAGDRGQLLITHSVDGSWQMYNRVRSLKLWYWSAATPVDVGQLWTKDYTIIPRGMYINGFYRLQSEITPHELEAVLSL